MKPLRIGLVTYAMHCGGVETFLLRLGKYLTQQGMDVEIVTCEERGEWFHRIEEAGLKGLDLSEHVGRMPLLRAIEIGRRLARRNYDVIFLNHSRDAQASLAMLADSTVAIPILHNDHEGIYRTGCANPWAWNVAVAVGPRVRAEVEVRAPRRPVVMIQYGVELPSESGWQRRAKWKEPIQLVFVGRLVHFQKGVLFLPDILQRCLDRGIDAVLTIVGDGPERQELQRKVGDLQLQGRVQFRGVLEPKQVYDALLEAHILLMPSFYEGMPIVSLEAQACGCVPVASRLQGITDAVVVDGETGFLVDVGDIAGFAEAILTLYKDRDRWKTMSAAGHERVARRFSVQAMGEAYIKLIEECLGGYYPLPRSRKRKFPVELGLFSWKEFVPRWAKRAWRRVRSQLGWTLSPT